MAKKKKKLLTKADWIWKFPYLFPSALNECKPPSCRPKKK